MSINLFDLTEKTGTITGEVHIQDGVGGNLSAIGKPSNKE